MYRIIESIRCVLETNVTLYVNYVSISIKKKKKMLAAKTQAWNREANQR